MKKIILLLFFFNISFSQPNGLGVEVRLIEGASASDVGLVNILNAHDVTNFLSKAGHPYPAIQDCIYQTDGGDNLNSLLADLLNYSSVVESAVIIDASGFPDCCTAQLLDMNIGIPIGFADNIVLTNDTQLNVIFQNFNVYFDAQTYPSSTWPDTLRYYSLACNCDAELLRDALEAYTAVIETTEPNGAAYLSLNDNVRTPLKIYPNPFEFSLEIESAHEVGNYSLIDVSGKLVINTPDYISMQNDLQNLKSGIYILKLYFKEGFFETRKMVKL